MNYLSMQHVVNGFIEAMYFAEGHNTACLAYMYSCKLVDQDKAEAFLLAYNSYCNDACLHVFSKRISKGF